MADLIQFKYGITKLFRIAKCINTPSGAYLDVPAADDDATHVGDSDILLESREILLVTNGAFDMLVPEVGTISLHAGDMSSGQRYRSALRIQASVDDSAYVCLTPRDHSFWNRESGFVASGDQIMVDTVDGAAESYVYVGVGGLTSAVGEHLVGSLVPLTGETTFTATFDTYFIHVWKLA